MPQTPHAPAARTVRPIAAMAAVALVAASVSGCTFFRQTALGLGALMGKTKPDYEALEASRGEAAFAATTAVEVDPDWRWEGFRGVDRAGAADVSSIRLDWPEEGPTVLWRQPIGGGYSSFAVAGGLAVTLEQRRDRECVVAYEIATGREAWVVSYDAEFSESFSGAGPRATPTIHEGRVYCLGATGELHCLEFADGAIVWRRNVLEDTDCEVLEYGLSASPLVVDGTLVVLSGAPSEDSPGTAVAYRLDDGGIAWTALKEKQAYATPILVTLAGMRQVLLTTASHAVGLDPWTGAELWRVPWQVMGGLSCAQPIVVGPDRVVVSGSYGAGAKLIELARGDPGLEPSIVWESNRLRNKFNSSVLRDGKIYGLDEGILTCVDAETGERVWKRGRFGYGQVLLVGEHLLVLGGKGDLALVRATPQGYEELERATVLAGNTWTPPTLVGGLLLIRNAAEMVCFDLRP